MRNFDLNFILSKNCVNIEYKLYFPNEDKYLPVGSFNFVGNAFHDRFNIKNSQTKDVSSGCWGWGLERIIEIFYKEGEQVDGGVSLVEIE